VVNQALRNESVGWSVGRSVRPSVGRSVSRLVIHSFIHSVSQSVSESISHSFIHSFIQSISQSLSHKSLCKYVKNYEIFKMAYSNLVEGFRVDQPYNCKAGFGILGQKILNSHDPYTLLLAYKL